MTDVNELKSKLAEIRDQEKLILSELQQQQETVARQITEWVVDRESLVAIVEQINRIAAGFGLMAVVRKQGAERKPKSS